MRIYRRILNVLKRRTYEKIGDVDTIHVSPKFRSKLNVGECLVTRIY